MGNVNLVELLRFLLQCGFILFNLSVMVYICRGRRSDPKLRSGFFVLFLAVTTADWVNSVTFVLINTLPNAFHFAEAFAATVSCKWYMITGWCMIFQALMHTTIAFNRFSCFYFPDQLNWLWTGRRIAVMLSAYVVISVVSTMHHYISPCVYLVIGGRLVGVPVIDATPQLIGMVTMALIYTFGSVTSFILSTATIRRLLLIRKYGRLTTAVWLEIRLFLHSLLLLALQAMYAAMFICRLPMLRNTPVGSVLFYIVGYGAGVLPPYPRAFAPSSRTRRAARRKCRPLLGLRRPLRTFAPISGLFFSLDRIDGYDRLVRETPLPPFLSLYLTVV